MHYKKYLKKQKQNQKKKEKKKNKHRLNHKYVVFFAFNFFMYINLLSIYSIKKKEKKSWKACGKQNIFPFLETVNGVTGTLQNHA